MIERAEYTAMAEQAIERFRTLSAIMPYNAEIVYVISREVYEAMQAYEYDFWNEHARVNVRPDGIVGVYYGTRLALINEDIADNFFMPVVYSRNFQHYNGLQVDDFVIFNDDDNDLLFRLARLTPDAMYTDTGLTVSFVLTRIHDIAATDNAVANLADNAVTIGDAIEELGQAVEDMNETVANWIADEIHGTRHDTPVRYVHDAIINPNNPYEVGVQTIEELIEAVQEMSTADYLTAEQVIRPNQLADGTITLNLDGAQINVDLLQELAGEVSTPRRAKKRTSKEKELNPGDTKLLDEYLHSFMKGGC